jgi:hypothetical protein
VPKSPPLAEGALFAVANVAPGSDAAAIDWSGVHEGSESAEITIKETENPIRRQVE